MFSNETNGFGDGGWWFIIILALLFGWGGNNGGMFGGRGVSDGYVLNSDFSSLSRQIDNGFSEQRGQGIQIANGISSLGYDQLAQMNNINQNVSAVGYNTKSAIDSCCCQNREAIANLNYNLATQSCATNNNISMYANQIMQNDNNSYRALHDEIVSNKLEAKDAQIAQMTQQINGLQLAASQQAQNAYLINQLRPQPVPSFPASNLYGYYGTTIS